MGIFEKIPLNNPAKPYFAGTPNPKKPLSPKITFSDSVIQNKHPPCPVIPCAGGKTAEAEEYTNEFVFRNVEDAVPYIS